MAKMTGTRTAAQQTVHGGHVAGDFLPHVFSHFKGLHLMANGLGQPRSRFTGGCRQTNAQRLATLHGRRLQQRQQPHHRRGFTGAGASRDDAESPACRQCARQFLPVDQRVGGRIGLAE